MLNFTIGTILGLVVGVFGFKFLFRKQIDEEIQKVGERVMAISFEHRNWLTLNPLFSPTIQNISPNFCEIYEQSVIAEKGKLLNVCGVGYGKSLEFLIKDYAKTENPQKQVAIEKCFLHNVVKEYINDDSIKNCSELAVWLRNDETHYIRKYDNKDVTHLKALIKLIIELIENAEERKLLAESVQTIKNSFP